MREGFDTRELTKFEHELLGIAKRDMPRKSKKFMRKEGSKLRKETLSYAKTVIKPSNKNTKKDEKHKKYLNSIKRGKPYDFAGSLCIRAYSNAPHAHLLEYGHRQLVNPGKGKGNGHGVKPGRGIGREVGFVAGYHIFDSTAVAFKDDYYSDTQEFIDDLFDKGLS